MPTDDQNLDTPTPLKHVALNHPKQSTGWFKVPEPVKRVFDQYPLLTYAANTLPLRAPGSTAQHVLHVFTSDQDVRDGRPSFNPSCLRWQTYLKLAGVQFTTRISSNHASPSGALPFLIPAGSQDAIPANRLRKWARTQERAGEVPEPRDVRYEAYASLLEGSVRKAWLYQLYLSPANGTLLHKLYVAPCSTNPLVQLTISHSLRRAAEAELVKASSTTTLVEEDVIREAEEGFSALSELLGEEQWFFGLPTASLFDASVFAYTQLILDGRLQWQENALRGVLEGFDNLVRHAERIERLYFSSG